MDYSGDPDNCRYCKHWHTLFPDRRDEGASGIVWEGRCRRYALAEFPRRFSHELCGEFEDDGFRKRLKAKEARDERRAIDREIYMLRARALTAEKKLKACRAELRALKKAKAGSK